MVLPQPSSFPRSSARTRHSSAPLNVTVPTQSTLRASGSRVSRTWRNAR